MERREVRERRKVREGLVGDWRRDLRVSRGWQRRRERIPEEEEERREI